MVVRVENVRADATYGLRQAVLRPHQSLAEMALVDDDDPRTGSFAAIAEDGGILGTARVGLAPLPLSLDIGDPGGGLTWRLRGMATREDARNGGVGSAVLGRVLEHVSDHGGGLLWCNARLAAVRFYERAGFATHGESFEEPDVGPHIVMSRLV